MSTRANVKMKQSVCVLLRTKLAGALTTKLATDASLVELSVGKNIGNYVQNCCTIIIGLVVAFVSGWELALLMCGLLPLTVLGHVINVRVRLWSSIVWFYNLSGMPFAILLSSLFVACLSRNSDFLTITLALQCFLLTLRTGWELHLMTRVALKAPPAKSSARYALP